MRTQGRFGGRGGFPGGPRSRCAAGAASAQAAPAASAGAPSRSAGLLTEAQAADEVRHAPARLLSVHLELGEAQALLDDLAIAEIVEGLRRAQDPFDRVLPAGPVEGGEERSPGRRLGERAPVGGVADPERGLPRRDQALPAEALHRGEVSVLPGAPGFVYVALPEGPVHTSEVPAPGVAEHRLACADSLLHPGHPRGGPPRDHYLSSPTGRVSPRRARNVRTSACASGSRAASRSATRRPSPTI